MTQHLMSRRTSLVSAAAFLSVNLAWAGTETTTFKRLPRDFDVARVEIKPPPIDDMTEARELFEMKKLRSPERLAEIRAQSEDPTPLFWQILGLTPTEAPQFARLVMDVQGDMVIVVLALKARYRRARAHTVLPSISPVIPVPWHASYPNGHAAQAHLMARLFSCARPDKLPQFLKLANRIGRNREVAGLHYPSDTEAGFALADSLWPLFRLNPAVVGALLRPSLSKG